MGLAIRYHEYAPAADLGRFVACLWTVTTEEPVPAYPVLPDGCVDIVFWAQGGLRAVGAMTTRQTVALPPQAWAVGIRFRPGAARRFLGVPMRELTDRSAPLEQLRGSWARRLHGRLLQASTAQQCVHLLAGGLPLPPATAGSFDWAIDTVVTTQGEADLGALARQANLSPRQFRRRCLEEVGLGPKRLCRVLRFRRALRLMRSGGNRGWAHVAAECSYYDQAHLIHDFREFGGCTPGQYAAAGGSR